MEIKEDLKMAVWGDWCLFPRGKGTYRRAILSKGNNHIRLYKRTETRLL